MTDITRINPSVSISSPEVDNEVDDVLPDGVSAGNTIVPGGTDKIYDGTLSLVGQNRDGFLDATGKILAGPYAGKRLVDYALEYAEQGWAVFPLRAGTKSGYFGNCAHCNPNSIHYDDDAHANGDEHCSVDHGGAYVKCHGLWAATTNPDIIRVWWLFQPLSNIAANVGRSGKVLIDVDIKPGEGKRGDQSITELEHRYEQFPARIEAVTASGGWHWVFNPADGIDMRSHTGKTIPKTGAKSGLADWVDIKANGGLMVMAPSVVTNQKGKVIGQYRWTTDWTETPSPMPLWVPQEIERRKNEGRPVRQSTAVQQHAGEDADRDEALAHLNDLADQVATMQAPGRHDLLLTNAGHAFRMAEAGQVTHADVAIQMKQAGTACGLGETDVRNCVRDAARWAVGKARAWKAKIDPEALLREYQEFMTPELRKSLFREVTTAEQDTQRPLGFVVDRPENLVTSDEIGKWRETHLATGVAPFNIAPFPLPEEELVWTVCCLLMPQTGRAQDRLREMRKDIIRSAEDGLDSVREAMMTHAIEVSRWNLLTSDHGAEGPGYEAWYGLRTAGVEAGLEDEEASLLADSNGCTKNAVEAAKQWRDANPDDCRRMAEVVTKWAADRYGISEEDYDPYDRITDEDIAHGGGNPMDDGSDGALPTRSTEAEELARELGRRKAVIDANRIEEAMAQKDASYRPSYQVKAYEWILGREKAQKQRSEELRIEEPEVDLQELFDQLTSGDETDRRPKFGYLADDDCGLFYAGTTNGIYGPSGIGKSIMIARLEVEALRSGGNVVHIEYDNNSDKMITIRLINAGVTREEMGRFKIVRSAEDIEKLDPEFTSDVTMAALDALTPAITALGGDVNQPGGVDLVIRTLLQPFTVHGAVGFFIGHVGHAELHRMAGSNRMFAAVQGALYLMEMVTRPVKGGRGLMKMVLKKDNQGEAGEVDKMAAYATYDSTSGDGKVRVILSRERDAQDLQAEALAIEEEKTNKMVRSVDEDVQSIWKTLSRAGKALSITELYITMKDTEDSMPKDRIRVRLDKMIRDGLALKDAEASLLPATEKGGKPCDRFRAVALPSSD